MSKAADDRYRKKVVVKVPDEPELADGSGQLRKGHSSAGYTMAAKRAAIEEGVAKPKKRAPRKP